MVEISARDFRQGVSEDMEDDTVRTDAPSKSEIPEGAILIIARLICVTNFNPPPHFMLTISVLVRMSIINFGLALCLKYFA